MNRTRTPSLSRKSFFFLLILSFFSISMMGLIWQHYSLDSQHRLIEKNLVDETRLVGITLRPALTLHDRQYALKILAELRNNNRFDSILIFDNRRQLLARTGNALPIPVRDHLYNDSKFLLHYGNALIVTHPIIFEGKALGHIATVTNDETMKQGMLSPYPVIFSGMGITFLITVLLALMGNRRYEKTLRRNEMLLDQLKDKNRALQLAKEEAEEANAAKDIFMANTSHELRTPLNGILGMNQLLAQSGLSEVQQEFSDSIHHSARHLLSIVEQLLDLSIVDQTDHTGENRPFSPSGLITDIIRNKYMQANEKGLRLSSHIGEDVPSKLNGNATALRQILGNVIDNAVKYTASGSIHVEVHRQKEQLLLEVHDSGIGIDRAEQSHIFDSFFRGQHIDRGSVSGMGLGLAICKKLLSKAGGDIRVESSPGEGSTFSIRFPFREHATRPSSLPEWIQQIAVISDDEWLVRQLQSYCHILAGGRHIPFINHWPEHDAENTLMMMDSHSQSETDTIKERAQLWLIQPGMENGCSGHCLVFPCSLQKLASAIERIEPPVVTTSGEQEINIRPIQGRVLIVEDNAINRKIAQAALRPLNVEVREAVNGREAVAMAKQHSFDCILMDIRMPEMDGITATRAIRTHHGSKRLPIIGITAHALQSEIEKALAAGMDRVITKPIDIHALARDVNEILTCHPDTQTGIDLALLLHDLGDDQQLFNDVVMELTERLQSQLRNLELAVQNGESASLVAELDHLSDTLATIHARQQLQQLQALATAARANDIEFVRHTWTEFNHGMSLIIRQLKGAFSSPA